MITSKLFKETYNHALKKELILIGCIMLAFVLVAELMHVVLVKQYSGQFQEDNEVIRLAEEYSLSEMYTSADGQYTYRLNLNDDTIFIVSYKGTKEKEVHIPESIDGKKVTALGETCFTFHDELIKVVVPNTVNHIQMVIWGSCPNLEEVYFEGDVEHLEKYIFGDFAEDAVVIVPKGSQIAGYAANEGIHIKEY